MKRSARKQFVVPFARSYWVVPGMLLAGYYPGDINAPEMEMKMKLKGLLHAGIRYTINLMEETELNRYGNAFTAYQTDLRKYAKEIGIQITSVRRPIQDVSTPTREEMKAILNEIGLAMDNNKPVYVHCLGGKGRTGTVVGCYLMRQGIATESTVLEMIQLLRKNDPEARSLSPETTHQRQMVINWKKENNDGKA